MQRRPDSEFEIRIEYAAILSALHETANGTQNDAERFLRQAATKRGIAFETFVSGLLENIHRPFLKPCRERPLKESGRVANNVRSRIGEDAQTHELMFKPGTKRIVVGVARGSELALEVV